MVSGEGGRLTSLDGDEYIGYVSAYFAGRFGHSNAAIKAANEEAAQDLRPWLCMSRDG